MSMSRRLLSVAAAVGLVVAMVSVSGAAANEHKPYVEPIGWVEHDVMNLCTGNVIDISWAGTVRTQAFGDHFVQHYKGDVWSTDGFAGTLNSQIVINRNTETYVFHDREISNELHIVAHYKYQFHVTVVDGEPVATIGPVEITKCTGKPPK